MERVFAFNFRLFVWKELLLFVDFMFFIVNIIIIFLIFLIILLINMIITVVILIILVLVVMVIVIIIVILSLILIVINSNNVIHRLSVLSSPSCKIKWHSSEEQVYRYLDMYIFI